jgi:hypothetical protein
MKRGSLHPLLMDLYPLAVAAVSRQRTRVGIGPDQGEDVRDFDVVCSIITAEAEKGIDWSATSTLPPEIELVPEEVEMPEDEKGFEIQPEDDATVELPAITREQLEERVRGNKALEDAARREYEEEHPKVTVGTPTVKRGLPEVLEDLKNRSDTLAVEEEERARKLKAELERQHRLNRVTQILAGALANHLHPIHNMDTAHQLDWALKMERTLILRATRPIAQEDLVFESRRERNEREQGR